MRTVRRQDDEGHTRLTRLDHGRIQVGNRGPRGRDDRSRLGRVGGRVVLSHAPFVGRSLFDGLRRLYAGDVT